MTTNKIHHLFKTYTMKKGTIITALVALAFGATAQVESSMPITPKKDTVPVKLKTDTMFQSNTVKTDSISTGSYVEKYKQDSVLNNLHNSTVNQFDPNRQPVTVTPTTGIPQTTPTATNPATQPLTSTPVTSTPMTQPFSNTPTNTNAPTVGQPLTSTPVATTPLNGTTSADNVYKPYVNPAYTPLDNGRVSIVGGQTYITSNNRAELVTKDVTLTDGTIVMSNGTIKKSNGKTLKLSNGQGYSYGQSAEKPKQSSSSKKDQK